MASSSDNETNVNPTQVDSSDQPDELNQNTEPQNPGLNTRNTAQISASPTQHITSNTYVFTTPIKLTQSNFMLWKSQVISSIRANELEGFVNGSHVCPPKVFMSPGPNRTTITTPNPEYQIWRKQDHILLSWLLSSLSEGVLGTVVDCSTSCEVWTTLANQFGARTRARILYLRTQIQTTKKGSSTIHEYYSKMKTLLNSLRAAGNNMNDDDFIMCVLAGMGPEYDSVVTNINSMQESPSISEVYGMLLSQENRTEQNLSSGNIEANYAQMRNGRRSWNNSERAAHQQLPRIVFKNPGNNPTNNQTNQNPQDKGKGKAVADDNGSDPKGPCQICWKMGHTAAECWHRFKKNFVPQPNRRREQRGAYVAAAEGQSSGAWYLDSGATNHVTNTLGNLSINSKYQESINNSSCPVSMLSFNSSNESVKVSVESNIADESSSNNLQVAEEIDVVSFSVNSSHDLTQVATAHSNSPDTTGNTECIPSPIQNEMQQVNDIDTISGSFSTYSPPHITKTNNQNLPTQNALPSHPMVTRSKAGIFKPKLYQVSSKTQPFLPKNTFDALKNPKWKRAMEEEYHALMKNKTWTLTPNNQNFKLIGNKWIYKVKENSDGSINKYKARLVAKGFLQTPGLDFNKTFSPVVKAATIRIILTMAVNNDWLLRQVDINNAFLNGDLTEAVYMPQPEGFEDKNRPSYICKLEKALYGLRQAPRAWFDKLKGALSCWGFKNSKSDTSLFFRRIESKIVIMLIYVDDIIITGSDSQGIEEVIKDLNTSFALKDLGNLNFFLGIQVQRSQNSLLLSQVKYIQDLLTKTEMTDCKGIETPFSTSEKLKKGVGNRFHDPTLYRSVIGSLQYAVLTRLELAFSVNKLSQFMSDPRQPHWVACKRVLRYLKNTMNMCLSFKKSEHLDLIAYTDADWATDPDDRRSISGYCVYLGDNLVAWSSRKQGMVARSTAESEYRAMALCSTEITWINSLLGELKMEVENVPIILCDSTSAAAIAANPVYHSRTKHFEIDLHFLRDKVTKGELEINYIGSNDQIADVLTKPLPHHKFSCFRSKLKVIDKTLSLREGVENSSSEEAKIDLEAKLACHLSLCNLQPADMEDESRLLRWQNSCAEEYQHISMEQLNLLEF
ncbi:retrovirus-related pol polyprotein from transposon RE1 [Citrus sinensis]|nr:retrovirus-related pol polyprotein from transposon RE1 [Citrus sinensis]